MQVICSSMVIVSEVLVSRIVPDACAPLNPGSLNVRAGVAGGLGEAACEGEGEGDGLDGEAALVPPHAAIARATAATPTAAPRPNPPNSLAHRSRVFPSRLPDHARPTAALPPASSPGR